MANPISRWDAWLERLVGFSLVLALCAIGWVNALDILNPAYFHEELRNLYHFDPERTNSKDFIGGFLAAFNQPLLYSYLTESALALGVDLVSFHKMLALLCGLFFWLGGAVAGFRLGGLLPAAAVAVLLAAQPIYQFQMNSAVPHAFAFPLLMWGLVCLLYNRPYWLAAVTLISGLLYPSISPVLGLCLAWYCLLVRRSWSLPPAKRTLDLLVLCVTGVLTALLLWKQLAPVEGYGLPIGVGEQVDMFPENGPGARHFLGVFEPMGYVFISAYLQFRSSLPQGAILALIFVFMALAGYGFFQSSHQTALFRSVLSFLVPSVVFCALIFALRPTLGYRFFLYPFFTLLPILLVYGLRVICQRYRSRLRLPAVVFGGVVLLLIASLNGMDADRNGFKLRLDGDSRRLMTFIRGLPQESLLAIWPNGRARPTSLIPYVAQRPVLVFHKAHYPTNEGYILDMRNRMYDLVEAYLASDAHYIVNLRCRWQVDYIVVDQQLFVGEKQKLDYFAPFNTRIHEILENTPRSAMVLANPPAASVVFQSGDYSVVDVAVLSDSVNCSPLARLVNQTVE